MMLKKEGEKNMVYVFLAKGFEEIEALTLVDVLRRAEITVKMVAVDAQGKMVTGAHGISVLADCMEEEVVVDQAQMFVLPGGMPGTTNLEQNETVQQALAHATTSGKWIAAICAAPMILGNKGYLKNKEAICYPGFEKYLQGAVIKDNRVNIYDTFITSKGPGTASDFSFAIVSVLKNQDIAHQLKVKMQY